MSYPEPLIIPGDSPSAVPRSVICISDEWIPYLVGVAEAMLRSTYWQGDEAERLQAQEWAAELISLLQGGCGDGVMETALFADIKATGVFGGASVAGWQTRTINSTVYSQTWASLNANTITLQPGKYLIEASAPALSVHRHQIALWHVTNQVLFGYGQNAFTNNGSVYATTASHLQTVLALSVATGFQLRHYTQSAVAIQGLGAAVSQGDEVYAMVKITKLSD